MNQPIIIGLTGGIGAGKSVVSKLLRTMGYPVFDSDKEAKILMDKSLVILNGLKERYGEEIYTNNSLNKPLLASKIFNDKEELKFVNNLVHPVVRNEFDEWARKQSSNLVFLESAILFESGFDKFVNHIWFVKASPELRIKRVVRRDSCDKEKVSQRINSQMDDSVKESKSSLVIDNDGMNALIPQLIKSVNKVIETNN